MYILISSNNGRHYPELVSTKKKNIVDYLKEKGYYYSGKLGVYTHKNHSCINNQDYLIHEIKEI
jgi:hypothetical protein